MERYALGTGMAQVAAGTSASEKGMGKGQRLFQEALERAKRDQESMEYFSMIDFAVDCYAEVAASRIYPDQPALRNWAVNGYMLAWREHFLKDQEEEHLERCL